jgi:hypothetical protein
MATYSAVLFIVCTANESGEMPNEKQPPLLKPGDLNCPFCNKEPA